MYLNYKNIYTAPPPLLNPTHSNEVVQEAVLLIVTNANDKTLYNNKAEINEMRLSAMVRANKFS